MRTRVSRLILDASALLAVIFGERGADIVASRIQEAAISTVNLAEVVAKLADEDSSDEAMRLTINDLNLEIVPFDEETAIHSGLLRQHTQGVGLSLGDRACLSLAKRRGLPVLTADRRWAEIDVGVDVHLIR